MSEEPRVSKALSSVDAAWLRMDEPTNRMIINVVFTFDEAVDFNLFRERIEQRLLRHERFRQRVTESRVPLATPHWETDVHFDIRAHLHHVALPAPGDQPALEVLVSEQMSAPLDHSIPLWQITFVEGYGKGTALIVRLHHCIGDGISLVPVLLSIMDGMENLVPPIERSHETTLVPTFVRSAASAFTKTMHAGEMMLNEGRDLVVHPEHALEMAKQGAMSAAALGRLLLLPSDPKTVLKGELGVSKRASWSKALSLDAVRGAAKRTGGTINDVMLSVLCGAISRYVTLRGGETDGVTIRAICPVNLRGKDIGPMGNHFGLVFVDLPLDDPEPVGRMRRIKSQVDHIKSSPDAVVALGVLGAMGMASPDLEHLGVEIFTRKASTLMTNVPGPPTRMSFSGKPVTSVMVWAPVSGRVGLGVSVLSYAGEVRVGVAADAGLVPDPEQIVVCFEQEWAHYLETVSRI